MGSGSTIHRSMRPGPKLRYVNNRCLGIEAALVSAVLRRCFSNSVDAPVHVFIDIITFELQYFPALIRSAAHMRRSPDSVILP